MGRGNGSPATRTSRSNVRVSFLRSVEELESVRDSWVALLGEHVTADPDYFVRALETDPHRNKLRRELGDRASVVMFDRPEQLDEMFADIDAVAVRRTSTGSAWWTARGDVDGR